MDNFIWDQQRMLRTGVAEAVFCSNKSNDDLKAIIMFNLLNDNSILLTRLKHQQWLALPAPN